MFCIKNISIPDGVSTIESAAFFNDNAITYIYIPGSVEFIGTQAFSICSYLENIEVDADNQHYTSAGGVLFDKEKKILMQYPVSNKRTAYSIHESVETIGIEAFCYSNYLTEISIPASVSSIDLNAFSHCRRLINISVAPENKNYKVIDNVLFDIDARTLLRYPSGSPKTVYTIPSGVTTIEASSFDDRSKLQEVVIPDTVTSIGFEAFNFCTNLRKVEIPNSVDTLLDFTFGYCENLTGVYIPESVTVIESNVFDSCPSLTIYGRAGRDTPTITVYPSSR